MDRGGEGQLMLLCVFLPTVPLSHSFDESSICEKSLSESAVQENPKAKSHQRKETKQMKTSLPQNNGNHKTTTITTIVETLVLYITR